MNPERVDPRERPEPRPGWQTWVSTAAFYALCVSIATWPRVLSLRWALPDRFDALQHLWIMRWYKACLLEGRSIFHCPEIQYPIGATLGNFSSLHLEALFFVPLSLLNIDDVVCYNVVWLIGLLVTGLGTFLLAWHVLGDRACAAFGGMLAMLSAPMMIHAHGHLELIHVGWFPLFLVAWMRLLDRPGWGRLALSALAYILVAMSAAYFMVFAIFPAALYVAWQAGREGWHGAWPWLRRRAPWLLGFTGLILPVLVVLFSSQFWALGHGYSLNRPREEFAHFGAPLWSYAVPSGFHLLGSLLPSDPYAALRETAGERTAYLGVVTIALMAYAALRRVTFRNAGYLWAAFLLLVVLSLGASRQVAGHKVSLPSAWVWEVFPLYRMTRVPARLSLFAGVLAGTLAAAGLRRLLASLPSRGWRIAVFGGLTAVAVADLAMIPFWMEGVPTQPGCYAFLKLHDPNAAIVEVPYLGPGGSNLNAACTYWQSLHRLKTSAGYSGHDNAIEDARIGFASPFQAARLARVDYLETPDHLNFDVVTDVDFKDFLWLYLTSNGFDYIVLHHWEKSSPGLPLHLDRLKTLLLECKVYEDGASIVYARSRLRPPSRPVPICLEEWRERNHWQDRFNCLIPKTARMLVYNPDPSRAMTLSLDVAAPYRDQSVHLRAGSEELASWTLPRRAYQHCVSPPFRLPAGLHTLTIDVESSGRKDEERASKRPYRLRVASVHLSIAPEARDEPPPATLAGKFPISH